MSTSDLRRSLMALDALGVVLGVLVGELVADRIGTESARVAAEPIQRLVAIAALVALAHVATSRTGLHRACIASVPGQAAPRVGAVAGVVAGAWYGLATGRTWQAAAAVAACVAVAFALGRVAFQLWVRQRRADGTLWRPVLVVGPPAERAVVTDLLHHHPEIGLRVVGAVGGRGTSRRDDGITGHTDAAVPWLGPVTHALDAARASGAGGVIVVANALPPADLADLLDRLAAAGLHVHVWSGLLGISQRRLRWAPMAHEPFLYLEPHGLSSAQLAVKRVLDVVLASVALVLSLPVLLPAALAVKLHDRGPVLFRQQRVGAGGRVFTLLKLRTMTEDAERRRAHLAGRNERQGGPLFKLHDDPRVTRLGKVLRALSIDELPQLVNVLRGDLSLVGPRPALPDEVAQFDEDLLARDRMRPGITGLWQVEARDNPSFYAYRHLDLFYVENWSVSLDLAILAATVPVVLAGAAGAARRAHARRRQADEPVTSRPPTTPAAPATPAPPTAPAPPATPALPSTIDLTVQGVLHGLAADVERIEEDLADELAI